MINVALLSTSSKMNSSVVRSSSPRLRLAMSPSVFYEQKQTRLQLFDPIYNYCTTNLSQVMMSVEVKDVKGALCNFLGGRKQTKR